jgi:hypothetical protein
MALKDRPDVIKSKPKKPSGDYKKFAIQKYPSNVSDFYMSGGGGSKKFIDKNTKIVSIGSCFAENIARFLRAHKYNYINTEKGSGYFSANWGIVFNSSSIRQIFEYSFGLFHPKVQWWEREKGRMQDPYRRDIIYPKGVHNQKRIAHYAASRQALEKADVIIITLGLTEVWRDKRDGATFWRVPPMHLYDPDIYTFHSMTVNEVFQDLLRIRFLLDRFNKKCHLIITVSPVPFQATYREDCDAVTANVFSKAVSSVAAIDFASELRDRNVSYFPSFEYVRYGFKNPYIADGRHIKRPVVNQMMKFFESMFCK